jgi:hypothetical protein
MGYRVRNSDGELKFPSLGDIAKAYRNGLVEPDDEVRDERSTEWKKASSMLVLRDERPAPRRHSPARLIVLAIVLIVCVAALVALRGNWQGQLLLLAVAFIGVVFGLQVTPGAFRVRRSPNDR